MYHNQTVRTALQWSTAVLGTLSLGIVVYGFSMTPPDGQELLGRLLPNHVTGDIEWVTINPNRVASGTTVPANKNVIIHFPEDMGRITRRTAFGRKGDDVRYWGLCGLNEVEQHRRGFPGKMFLSEAERAHRRQVLLQQRRRTFSVFKHLNEQDLNESRPGPRSNIKHEIDVFWGGTTCFVMSEKAIPLGTDIDDDGLNSALERGYGADEKNPDTDGDGVLDGLEVFRAFSHPTKSDSDGDGIPDGIEDSNRNGLFEPGETNPTLWDTDRDGLCDGLCKVNKGQDLRGEDRNLNGIVDDGEYDPRKVDSDDDGILDEHEVYLCVINGGDDC